MDIIEKSTGGAVRLNRLFPLALFWGDAALYIILLYLNCLILSSLVVFRKSQDQGDGDAWQGNCLGTQFKWKIFLLFCVRFRLTIHLLIFIVE